MLCSECHADFEADAPAVRVGIMKVGDAADVVDFDEFEDVVDADAPLHVGGVLIHADGVLLVGPVGKEMAWEIEEFWVGIVEGGGVVLVGELSPKHVDAKTLAPLEFVEERNAVEEPSVEVPLGEESGIAVVEELEVGDEIESVVLDDVGGIGGRMDEQWEGHFVPFSTGLEVDVALAELSQPETFVQTCFREVVVVLSAEESIDASGVAEGEDGGIVVDLDASLFGVDVGDVGLVGGADFELGGGDA